MADQTPSPLIDFVDDERARSVMAVALASLVTGVCVGIGARLIMRLVALSIPGRQSIFSWEGTIFLLFPVVFGSLPFGLLFLVFRRYVRASPLRQGLLYGGALLLLFGLPWFFSDVLQEESFRIGIPLFNRVLFALLFVGYGVLVALITTWIERHPGIVTALLKTD